jgi:hypothetical protein
MSWEDVEDMMGEWCHADIASLTSASDLALRCLAWGTYAPASSAKGEENVSACLPKGDQEGITATGTGKDGAPFPKRDDEEEARGT